MRLNSGTGPYAGPLVCCIRTPSPKQPVKSQGIKHKMVRYFIPLFLLRFGSPPFDIAPRGRRSRRRFMLGSLYGWITCEPLLTRDRFRKF